MIPRIIARSSGRARPVSRLAGAVIAVIALVGSLAIATPAAAAVAVEQNAQSASQIVDAGMVKAAPVVGFNAENIISDALFYDNAAMTAAEIQAFLDARIGTCNNGKCLNVLNAGISSRGEVRSQSTGNLICSAIQGGTMKVSELIYRVQVACGISAKVILVTLQKEQGLTTSKAPSDWNLSAAMGASCPDTAPCDPAFAGVGPQILKGTQQLMTYKAARFGKQPGVNFIGYSPNSACGGTNLNIQNYATAALYTYTPYQPNGAALAAGFGLGDACSAYGNRNFYNYYTQWFGSTQIDDSGASAAIANAYLRSGGANGKLGTVNGDLICGLVKGGCFQQYLGGRITWSSASGAYPTFGGIGSAWLRVGAESGQLGYPTSFENCGLPQGGCYQEFQLGKVYWTSQTDARPVISQIAGGWAVHKYERGWLGYPVEDGTCGLAREGCSQTFQGGEIYWSAASGAYPVHGSIADAWRALGATKSKLGYPRSAEGCGLPNAGCYQEFQGGKLYWSPTSGAFSVGGGILSTYAASGYERGTMGYPVSEETCGLAGGGCVQSYAGGAIYWSSPTGAQTVRADLVKGYLAIGGPASKLGYPRGSQGCGLPQGGCYQEFSGGMLHWSTATGAHATWGGISQLWGALNRERGSLGYPLGSELCDASSCVQQFQSGTVYWTAVTGAVSVRGQLLAAYEVAGGPQGRLGYPVAEQLCSSGTCRQQFAKGTLP